MAEQLKDYEAAKYESWMAETEHNLPSLMKKPILAMVTSKNSTQTELVCVICYFLITVVSYIVC